MCVCIYVCKYVCEYACVRVSQVVPNLTPLASIFWSSSDIICLDMCIRINNINI